MFSGGLEKEQWHKMGYNNQIKIQEIKYISFINYLIKQKNCFVTFDIPKTKEEVVNVYVITS